MYVLSGITKLLISVVTLLLLCQGTVSFDQTSEWILSCDPTNTTIHMHHTEEITCNITGPELIGGCRLVINSENLNIAEATEEIWLNIDGHVHFQPKFNITGNFLGKTTVIIKLLEPLTNKVIARDEVQVIVIRQKRVIDTVFHASVAILVSLMYINFGCALKWDEVRETLRRPYGPIIGLVGQFLFMPVISFFVGKLLFPGGSDDTLSKVNYAMQLGLFFTGVSPGGGASNMWTVILGGNIDLSITMTTLSQLFAFGMMPVWLFTLGRLIFDKAALEVPYKMIFMYTVTLVVPLAIGYAIRRCLPRVADVMARLLKGFSSLLLVFIVVFAIVANLYLFQLFSWQIVIAGLGLPWLGYILAWILATLFKQPRIDALTIAIETGIQNTGISIFLLRYTLDQPEADLTTVVPVSVAIMTPIPLLLLFIYQKITERFGRKHRRIQKDSVTKQMAKDELEDR